MYCATLKSYRKATCLYMKDDSTPKKTRHNGNQRYIQLSDNIPEHWDALIKIAKSSYTHYWYIIHDKDVYTQRDLDEAIKHGKEINFSLGQPKLPHLHLVCYDVAGTTLKSHCRRFSSVIAANFIEPVDSSRAFLRYLIHKDDPDKYQYDKSLVESDFIRQFYQSIGDIQCTSEYEDFEKLMKMEVSPRDYVKKYEYEIDKLNFGQKLGVYKNIFDSYGRLCLTK